ncbi:MAG: ABC transporter ATP-binding protein [Patescibacteria group bacterium]
MSSAEEKKINTDVLPVLKYYAKATARYPWLFTLVVGAILAATATNLIAPLFLKDFIDLLIANDDSRTVIDATILALGLYAAAMFANWASIRLQVIGVTRIEAKIQSDLTNEAFAYLIHHGHDFFANNFAGTLTRRVNRYARSYQQIFNNIMEGMVPTLLFAVGVIVVLFTQNLWLGLGLLVWTVFFLLLQYLMTKWRYQYKLQRAIQDSRVTGALSDAVGSHSAIAAFAAEDHEKARLAGVVADWFGATMKAWNSDVLNYAIQGFLTRTAQIGLLILALYLWWKGSITVGDVVLIQVYIFSLMDQITNIGSNMRQLYDAVAEANEMIDIMEEPHAIQDAPDARELAITAGEIALESVVFAYKQASPILDDLTLTITAREKIALVGPSGAGKSTITKLLLRLYDVTSGTIRIDGHELRTVTRESLRKAISFVPQEPALFHRTLRDNIAYGRPDASLEEVIEAAKKAHAHEFISRFPQGYDTYVGERGVKLSGGERQRVAIARAILKNAPILILDEATSSLDSESEALIQDALRTLMEGKTVVVIAHRLSTIMSMDRIVVIEGGKIIAEGTHDELVAQEGGLYHKLWSIQAGGFLAE